MPTWICDWIFKRTQIMQKLKIHLTEQSDIIHGTKSKIYSIQIIILF